MSEYMNGTSHIEMDESTLNNAKVKVFGVGGAGGNTVNRMVGMNIQGVEYYAVNTDAMALELSLADHKIAIGQKTTKTLGAGAKPDVGRKAAEESVEELKEAMKGADLIFVTAGMGGGTGTGAAPVIGAAARELGILTIAVVTKPFRHEGPVRSRNAEKGIKNLRDTVDTMIVVDNKKLMNVVENTDKNMTLEGAFKLTDDILGNAVRSICDIMFRHGLIHVDFADVKTVMTNGGSALMGTGIAEGENRGIKAVDMALSSPLLEDVNVEGATGVLVNVSHGESFSMIEYSEAMEHIYEAVGDMGDPNIIIGDILLPELGDKVCITIIATGCGNTGIQQSASAQVAQQPYVAPTPRPSDLVNTIGSPAGFSQAPVQQAPVAPQPVQPTPRPTSLNFVALAHNTVAMPAVAPAAPQATFTQQGAVQQPAQGYAAPEFSATAPAAEESILGTPNASLPETQEFSAVADVDDMNGVHETASVSAMREEPTNLGTPTFIRQQALAAAPAAKSTQYEAGSLKSNGVDYDVPAFLRGNALSDIF
ncbi:cell division protein FtsZ [Fibrobacter sp. UBA3718]|uniref:cell division protein FtsZ n=1 Tax=Fibrobacter sp. UBA3718 TaxID=1946531 RepID=UPI0025B82A99|nr:cell division protein FtsZ [Fibrobacter sp. UBA3718]